ncbi:MAG: flagellar hook-length control protein FliK, partial [Bdellovibrionales bacterium]|nr:flagellar hook-length control protein FliK [Bdellovibrionales bacterium]
VGVPTDQLIRAMKSLPAEAMTDSPQQNMGQIISALGLAPDKQVVAEKLFQGMASNLGEGALAADIHKYSPKFLEREAWLDNVDQISQRFFMRNQEQLGMTGPLLQNNAQDGLRPTNVSKPDENSKAPFGVALAPMAGLGAGPIASAALMAGPQTQIGEKLTPASVREAKTENLDTLLNEMAGEVESVDLGKGAQAKSEFFARQSVPTPTMPLPTEAAKIAKPIAMSPVTVAFSSSLKGALSKNSDKANSEEGLETLGEAAPALAGQELRSFDQELLAEDVGALKAPLTKDPVQNLQELNQSAASIIKDGGGEIVMKLKPEGLGEVKLKVMVENGRVNVEMIADNPETKRMLESQSMDLKKSLEAQLIQVDGMKIDVRDSSQTQNERHPQQNNFDREMARDFLGQFRDQNQAFRQSMFELPNVKAYRGTGKQAEEIRPTPAARTRSEGNKRLNLVA